MLHQRYNSYSAIELQPMLTIKGVNWHGWFLLTPRVMKKFKPQKIEQSHFL